MHPHFRVLWQASTIARYLHDNETSTKYSKFSDYMSSDVVAKELVEKRLLKMEQMVIEKLDEELRAKIVKVKFGNKLPDPKNSRHTKPDVPK